jgi:hypothetical protein
MSDQTTSSIERDRKYAWDYFSQHSSQRMATFNFYITLALAIITGIATVIQPSINLPSVALVLSFVLILISFVFYKLDLRNKMLIKLAEAALMETERKLDGGDSSQISIQSLFRLDDRNVGQRRAKKSFWFWKNHYSYSDCFNIVFTIFWLLGLLGVVFAVAMLLF